MKVLVIHGPNLNMVGRREEIYGSKTLDEINSAIKKKAEELGLAIDFFQSNHEGEIIDKIHQSCDSYDALIINPGGLTHYSVCLRDALAVFKGVKIEVHMTNIFSREDYRKKTVTAEAVDGVIAGFGDNSYIIALEALKVIG